MNLHQRMLLQTQRAKLLLNDASENVEDFIQSQIGAAGGFIDRAGQDDLYYTVFGLDVLLALHVSIPECIESFITKQTHIPSLDLVHLCCLIRCADTLQLDTFIQSKRDELLESLESFCSVDGAYNQEKKARSGSAYACFLVMDAYQCLGLSVPRPSALISCIQAVACGDGGFSLLPQEKMGTTPTTCAALIALEQCGEQIPKHSEAWLRERWSPSGGFVAGPLTPVPDLLSTATALHGLSLFGDDCSDIRESCLDFVDSLWSSRGSFYAYWDDNHLDCEYTFYGLLALGHLAEPSAA